MVYGSASAESAGRSFFPKDSLIGSSSSAGSRPNAYHLIPRRLFSGDACKRPDPNTIGAAPHAVCSPNLGSTPSTKNLIPGTLCSPQ